MKTNIPFKDISIFQGVKEFITDTGEHVKIDKNKLFIMKENAWLFDGFVNSRSLSIKKIWNDYIKSEVVQ